MRVAAVEIGQEAGGHQVPGAAAPVALGLSLTDMVPSAAEQMLMSAHDYATERHPYHVRTSSKELSQR